jgi:hypothetical protein
MGNGVCQLNFAESAPFKHQLFSALFSNSGDSKCVSAVLPWHQSGSLHSYLTPIYAGLFYRACAGSWLAVRCSISVGVSCI